MTTPLEFLLRYRRLRVGVVEDDPIHRVCREATRVVKLRRYFMMNWTEGTDQRTDFNFVTRGGRGSDWFRRHRDAIMNAAMGKGSPTDYERALEWAVASGKILDPTQTAIQAFADDRLGIDCSGFVTNYLVAIGRKPDDPSTVRNTGAASYFSARNAVNDPTQVRQGDLLVWMRGNAVMRGPGHVALVQSYRARCIEGGNMRVCEATGASGANPKLLDSMYTVERIIDKGGRVPCMILVVRRHGRSGSRVAVIRV